KPSSQLLPERNDDRVVGVCPCASTYGLNDPIRYALSEKWRRTHPFDDESLKQVSGTRESFDNEETTLISRQIDTIVPVSHDCDCPLLAEEAGLRRLDISSIEDGYPQPSGELPAPIVRGDLVGHQI